MRPRVLVTRPAGQAPELRELLRERGVDTVCVPTVAIDTDAAASDLEAALESLDGAAWLVVTSRNGADALTRRLAAAGRGVPPGTRVAAVGPATAAALTAAGVTVDHVPDEYLTLAIADGLGDLAGRRVVLARADAVTPDLRDALSRRGAIVEEVVAYRTVEAPAEAKATLRAALRRHLDGVSFTSGSSVRGLVRLASRWDRSRARDLPAFCIGPVTAEVARRHGFRIAAVAEPHTAGGLAAAIAAHFRGEA